MLPDALVQPTTPVRALAFADALLANEHLALLVGATGSSGGSDVVDRALRSSRRLLTPQEQEQVDHVLAHRSRTAAVADPDGAATASREDRVAALRRFAARNWDFRCGRERDRIPTSAEVLPHDVAGLVTALADDWLMRTGHRAVGCFDAAVVLGGLLQSNVHRAAAASRILTAEAVVCPAVIGLAARRPLSPQERAASIRLRMPAETEAESLAQAIARAFDVDPTAWRLTSPGILEQRAGDGRRLAVAMVPLHAGGARPTTGDAFDWLLSAGEIEVGDRLMSVTTAIYWIQNHCNLLTRLPAEGARLVTASDPHPAPWLPAPVYRSQHYLQEIKAAIDVLPDLLAWAGSAVGGPAAP